MLACLLASRAIAGTHPMADETAFLRLGCPSQECRMCAPPPSSWFAGVRIYVCMHVHIHIHIYIRIRVGVYVYMYLHAYILTYIRRHACEPGRGHGEKKRETMGGGVFMQSAFSPSSQPCGGRDPARRFRQASDDERERVSVSVSVSIWLRGGPVSRSPHSCRPLHTHHLLSLNLSALGPCTRPLQRCIGSDPCCRSAGS